MKGKKVKRVDLIKIKQEELRTWLQEIPSLHPQDLSIIAHRQIEAQDITEIRELAARATKVTKAYTKLYEILAMLALALFYDEAAEKEMKEKEQEMHAKEKTKGIVKALRDLGIIS